MKYSLLAISAAMITLGSCQSQDKQIDKSVLKDPNKKASYALGIAIAKDLQRNTQGLTERDKQIDTALMYSALNNYLKTGKSYLDSAALQTTLMEWQTGLQERMMKEADELAVKNNKLGAEYINSQMAANPKLKKTASGLVYEVLQEGTGAQPKATSEVTVNYKGTLIDGSTFDESKGEPVTFGVSQVIKGWTEGLQLMKEGAKYRFLIPSDLAYGNQDRPPHIKPGSTLVFDVELLKIK
ncbi:MAG TPA: FKBP-type peptidyl-prolyl cis-trans isomerase [Edaphocola sp.]|nr:FKBP-type peptidyl-prolyl cis-trans isomerase [Edaphocola sp.]